MALYDTVLARGRVIDPESGLDGTRDVGIKDGTVLAISEADITGSASRVLDCSGCVVCAGFIDIHSHGMKPCDAELQACDGVTTHLELEFGCWPVPAFYDALEGNSCINFGCSVGHIPTRVAAMEDVALGFTLGDPCCMLEAKVTSAPSHKRTASDAELSKLFGLLAQGLDEGGVGIGAGIAYTPGSDHREVFRLQQFCARNQVALFIHMRGKHDVGLEDFHEVFTNAAVTGCPLHICHITPMICHLEASGPGRARAELTTIVNMIERLKEVGVDITMESYPYTAGMTNIASEIFMGDLKTVQSKFPNVKMPEAMQWLDTGEFLNEETFYRYRKKTEESGEGGMVYVHAMPQDLVDYAVPLPQMIIASDAIPYVDGKAHPRGAGCFCRVLREFVREKGALGLQQAISQMALLPARRLEKFCPAMAKKGRLCPGADADITVFNADTVADEATWTEPARKSSGVAQVLVNGVSVVLDGVFQEGVVPGRGVRGGRGTVTLAGSARAAGGGSGVSMAGSSGGGGAAAPAGHGGTYNRNSAKRFRTAGLYAAILESQDSAFLASLTGSL